MKTKDKSAIESIHSQIGQINNALVSGCDVATRTIYLVGEVNDEMFYKFAISFRVLNQVNAPIEIDINSCGGDEHTGYAIYDLIRASPNDVYIFGIGAVESSAALILQAGTVRILAPNAKFMIHNGTVCFEDTVESDSVVALGQELARNNERYQEILAKHSELDIKVVRSMCEAETFLTAEQAVELGFADMVDTKC